MTLPAPVRALSSRPYWLLTLAALGWSGNTIAGRLAVGQASPMAIVTLRWLVVVLVLAAALGRRPDRTEWAVLVRRWPYLLAMGGLGFTGFNALFYAAAQFTSAINMGVVQGVVPALVLAGSVLADRTPIRAPQVLGIAVSFVGVIAVASGGDLGILRDLAFNLGDVMMLVASALLAGYTVGLRRRPPVEALTFFAGLSTAALLSSLPLLGWEIASGRVLWPGPFGWAVILYIALVPSLACQLLYMRAVALIGPSRAGLFTNLVPLLSTFLAVLILGETLATYHGVALAGVVGGIWLAERSAGARTA